MCSRQQQDTHLLQGRQLRKVQLPPAAAATGAGAAAVSQRPQLAHNSVGSSLQPSNNAAAVGVCCRCWRVRLLTILLLLMVLGDAVRGCWLASSSRAACGGNRRRLLLR